MLSFVQLVLSSVLNIVLVVVQLMLSSVQNNVLVVVQLVFFFVPSFVQLRVCCSQKMRFENFFFHQNFSLQVEAQFLR